MPSFTLKYLSKHHIIQAVFTSTKYNSIFQTFLNPQYSLHTVHWNAYALYVAPGGLAGRSFQLPFGVYFLSFRVRWASSCIGGWYFVCFWVWFRFRSLMLWGLRWKHSDGIRRGWTCGEASKGFWRTSSEATIFKTRQSTIYIFRNEGVPKCISSIAGSWRLDFGSDPPWRESVHQQVETGDSQAPYIWVFS